MTEAQRPQPVQMEVQATPRAEVQLEGLMEESTEKPKETEDLSVDEVMEQVVAYCMKENVNNPVEILRCLQKKLVCGQALEVIDVTQCDNGKTNFIIVNRYNLLRTAFQEIKELKNYRLTLEVKFYGGKLL